MSLFPGNGEVAKSPEIIVIGRELPRQVGVRTRDASLSVSERIAHHAKVEEDGTGRARPFVVRAQHCGRKYI